MGQMYRASFSDIPISSSADTLITVLGIRLPNTTGQKVELRELIIGPSDDSPADANLYVRVNTSDGTGDGTFGTSIAAANVVKCDPDGTDCPCTVHIQASAEPTTYNTYPAFEVGLNTRGSFGFQFPKGMAPVASADETLGILVGQRGSGTAYRVSGSVCFEVL